MFPTLACCLGRTGVAHVPVLVRARAKCGQAPVCAPPVPPLSFVALSLGLFFGFVLPLLQMPRALARPAFLWRLNPARQRLRVSAERSLSLVRVQLGFVRCSSGPINS